jgi:hypothetical protein
MPGNPWTSEEWQIIARGEWDRWEGSRKQANQYVSDQSKWMVGQLFVANAGALGSLATSRAFSTALPASGVWFVVGLVLASLCGS